MNKQIKFENDQKYTNKNNTNNKTPTNTNIEQTLNQIVVIVQVMLARLIKMK